MGESMKDRVKAAMLVKNLTAESVGKALVLDDVTVPDAVALVVGLKGLDSPAREILRNYLRGVHDAHN